MPEADRELPAVSPDAAEITLPEGDGSAAAQVDSGPAAGRLLPSEEGPVRGGAAGMLRDDAAISRDDAAISRDDAAISRDDGAISCQDGAISCQDGAISCQDGAISCDDAAVSRGDPAPEGSGAPAVSAPAENTRAAAEASFTRHGRAMDGFRGSHS